MAHGAYAARETRGKHHHTRDRNPRIYTTYSNAPGLGQHHRHVATVDDEGNGWTDVGPDGTKHEVKELEVLEANAHAHALTEKRAI